MSALHMYTANTDFEGTIVEAIDESLNELGENVKTSIYFHMEDKFGIQKEKIPERIADFSNALEHIFGPGAKFLELLFIRKLHSKLNLTYPLTIRVHTLTFKECVWMLRKHIQFARNIRSHQLTQ